MKRLSLAVLVFLGCGGDSVGHERPATASTTTEPPEGGDPSGPSGSPNPGPAVVDLEVEFRLDPRLTRGVYMGERWVSPPTYSSVQPGDEFVVAVRAQARDRLGRRRAVRPRWSSADPTLVEVSELDGESVQLRVLGPGRTTVTLATGELSARLEVRASAQPGALRVDIAQ